MYFDIFFYQKCVQRYDKYKTNLEGGTLSSINPRISLILGLMLDLVLPSQLVLYIYIYIDPIGPLSKRSHGVQQECRLWGSDSVTSTKQTPFDGRETRPFLPPEGSPPIDPCVSQKAVRQFLFVFHMHGSRGITSAALRKPRP